MNHLTWLDKNAGFQGAKEWIVETEASLDTCESRKTQALWPIWAMTTLLLSCDGGCLWWMLLLEIGKQNNCIMLYMYDHIFKNSYQKICKTFVRMTMSSIVTQILLVSFRRDSSQKEFMPRISLDLVNMHQTNDETDSVRAKLYTLLPRTGACTSIWSTWLAARWLAFCISSGHSRRNLNIFFCLVRRSDTTPFAFWFARFCKNLYIYRVLPWVVLQSVDLRNLFKISKLFKLQGRCRSWIRNQSLVTSPMAFRYLA